MSKDPAALRQEWEALQREAVEDSRRRYQKELAQRDAVEEAGEVIRLGLTKKLSELLEVMGPYVDGTMGEPTAGMLSVYVKAVHELAGLYGLTRVARKLTQPLPVPEPPVVEVAGPEVEVRRLEGLREAGRLQLEDMRAKMTQRGLMVALGGGSDASDA